MCIKWKNDRYSELRLGLDASLSRTIEVQLGSAAHLTDTDRSLDPILMVEHSTCFVVSSFAGHIKTCDLRGVGLLFWLHSKVANIR